MYIDQAAARLGVSRRTLDRLTESGEIQYVRLGVGKGRKMFLDRWLVDYLRRRVVNAPEDEGR